MIAVWILTWTGRLFLLGLLAAGLRLAYEAWRGDFHRPARHPGEPWTTKDIAQEGLRRAKRAKDTSYIHYNSKIRR